MSVDYIFFSGVICSVMKRCTRFGGKWFKPLTELATNIGMTLKILDLGGGLGIDYLDEGATCYRGSKLLTTWLVIKAQAGVEELWLELGRFAVAECGYYVVPVVDKKMEL